ncbi:alpha/beta hydrolase [Nocardioides euryhalodurans]|uniref:Alpha/beta hydrolase n=1 Tax=Nocardioides euryhalodurans TaxID=2518370 RepID=A0A4P7GKK9_9ACTN|nr:alpha/beta hydrolase [Nocardioides euryhalodurans]QBR92600.1 alpha/beta hydrolase [Nocardioides euryhalodurans]
MRRLVAVVLVIALVGAGVGIAVGTIFGGSGGADPDADRPTRAAVPEPGSAKAPSRNLGEYYGQRLDWSPCGDHECARLTVPLDYDRPRGRTLELAVLRVPAQGERQGSLVVNPGGPGAPGTTYAAAGTRAFRQPLLDAFDIVGFDPRGTGASSPVDCVSDEQLDTYLAADPSPDDPAEEETFVDLVEAFGRGCVDDDAALAAHVSTIEAARDMDVLRSALGHRRLDYFGASYGTKLGATYAELFPSQVGHFVLDGAVDVSLPSRELSLGQAGGFETALRAYVGNCVETVDSCFLGDSVDEGLQRIQDFLDEVEASPLPTAGDRELAVGNAFYGIVAPLYVRDYWPILSSALRAGLGGDGTGLLQLADLYSSRGPDGFTDNSSEAMIAINCLDDPYAISADEVDAELPAFQEVSPTFGDVFAWGLVGCSGQVAETTEEPLDIDGAGAAPILVIGTTRDPATPYAWAEALADQLESGVLVSRDGDGHTGYNSDNACVDQVVEFYLVDGTVPEDGLSC